MKIYFQKIIAGLLIITVLAGSIAIPHKAEAAGASAVMEVGASLYKQVAQAASSLSTSYSTFAANFQNSVLNTIATAIAKQLIRMITASVVQWINSGFEGSPSFITNPGGFFLDVADQITGEFLAKYGGPLTDLCSPFSIDIRIALAFKYRPNIRKEFKCTLGAIITNSKNAIQGASINGFTAGDFKQGGWPAFVSLTTEPQNNVFGAYLKADSELSIRVANIQIGKKDEISNGQGFLSWRDPKCKKEVAKNNAQVKTNYEAGSEESYYKSLESGTGEGYYSGEVGSIKSINDCPIQTPGSVIGGSIQNHLNGPLRELELVDSINEIVNALAARLITVTLQGGLRALSGSGPSDQGAYINQIIAEENTTDQVSSLRNTFIENVATYLRDTLQYKTNKDQSLNLILEAKTSYDAVRACYAGKSVSTQQTQAKINEIDTIINTTITPVATQLLEKAKEADTRYKALTDLRDQANAAKTVNDLNTPSRTFAGMLQDQALITQKDITASEQELDEIKTKVAPMKQDAQRKKQECELFSYGTYQ